MVVKRSHVYTSGSSSISDASTPPPSPTGSSSSPVSSPEVSSQGLPLPLYEHGEPYEGIPVVDLSSEEEDAFPDTSRDDEIAQKLFGDLNRGLLGSPGDGNDNIIILNDSDEEEKLCEDDRADVEATPSSTGNSLAPTASIATDDDAPDEVQDDSSASSTPDQVQGGSGDGGDEVGTP
jgi:hypothetical protein